MSYLHIFQLTIYILHIQHQQGPQTGTIGGDGAHGGGGRQPIVMATYEKPRSDLTVGGGVTPGHSTRKALDRPGGTEV